MDRKFLTMYLNKFEAHLNLVKKSNVSSNNKCLLYVQELYHFSCF